MENCDVLIIGAGPSGAVAALVLSKAGVNTTVIEREKNPGMRTRTKIDITEESGIREIFDELELPFLAKSSSSKWFSKNESFDLNSKIQDYYLKRGPENDSFENIVMKKAISAGCVLKTESFPEKYEMEREGNGLANAKITDAEGKIAENQLPTAKTADGNEKTTSANGKVKSVRILSNGKSWTVSPRFVIIADGSRSQSAEMLGFHSGMKRKAEIFGYGVVSKRIKLPEGLTHIFVDSEKLPGGYFYAGKTEELGVACIVLPFEKKETTDIREKFGEFVHGNEILSKAVPETEEKEYFAGSCLPMDLKVQARGNVFLCGDAGGLMDPLFGYGARQAIFSGHSAAKAIISNFNKQENARSQYQKMLNRTILKENAKSWKGRDFFEGLSNDELDAMAGSFARMEKGNADAIIENPARHIGSLLSIFIRKPKMLKIAAKAIRHGVL